MPVLEQVDGNVWITTIYDVPSVCDDTDRVWGNGKIAGLYNCTIGSLRKSGSNPLQTTPSNQPRVASPTLSSGAIAGVAVAGAIVIALMSLVCCYKCCWQKPRPKRAEPSGDAHSPSGKTDAQTTVPPPIYVALLEDNNIRRAPHVEDQLRDVSDRKTVQSSEEIGELHMRDKQVVEVRDEMV